MTTASIIMSVCLIILKAAAVFIIIRYARLSSDMEKRMSLLEANEKAVQVRSNSLERWAEELNAQARRQAAAQHVYANVIVDDSDGSAPEKIDSRSMKQMKSKLGYKVAPLFKDYIKSERKDGTMRYSLDLNVYPFSDE